MATANPFTRPDSTVFSLATTSTETKDLQQEYNSENFIVIWLDETVDKTIDNLKLKGQIRSIVNCLKTFDTTHECVDYITRIKDEKIFFIVSGSVGEQIVPQIQQFPQIESIYVFCTNIVKHELWARSFEKVRGTFNDFGLICEELKRNLQQCSNNLLSFTSISATGCIGDGNLNRQEVSFMHLKLIKDIFIRMKTEATNQKLLNNVREEMIAFFRQQYAGNETGLQIINRFENDYCPQTSLEWYTRGCFIYETINKALRTLDVDILYKMRFFISELHEQLNELHLEPSSLAFSSNTVYRGQALSNADFQKLKDNCRGLLSVNNFLSTTTDCQIALTYAKANAGQPGFDSVLFEIEMDPTMKLNSPFASIQHLSHFGTENEVLFSMASVFRIESVGRLTNDIWIVTLKLSSAEDEQLKTLTDYMKKEIDRTDNLASLGTLMIKMGEFEKSNFFYKISLDNMALQHDTRGLSMLYNDIGSNYQAFHSVQNPQLRYSLS